MTDRSIPAREHVEGRDFGAVGQEAVIVPRIGAVEIAVEAKVAPAALLFPGDQALDRRARDDGERDPLADVGRIALPCAQRIGAHRARTRALRPEHVAVDAEGLLVAEQPGEIGRAVFAFEAVVADHRAARRQRAPLGGDALDMTTQFDLLGEQRGAGGAILGAFIGDSAPGRRERARRRTSRLGFRSWNSLSAVTDQGLNTGAHRLIRPRHCHFFGATSANIAPCGSRPFTIQLPPGTCTGPCTTLPPADLTRSPAASIASTVM